MLRCLFWAPYFSLFHYIQQRCDYKGSVNSRLHYLAHLSRLDWFNMEMFDFFFFSRPSRLLKMNSFFGSKEGPKGRNSWPGSWTPESFVPNTHLSRWCPITPWPLPFFELEENRFTMLCWFLPYSNTNQSWLYIYMHSYEVCVCIYPFPLEPPSPIPPPRSSQSIKLSSLCYTAASH